MGLNGAANLGFFDDVFVHVSNGFAQSYLLSVAELHVLKVRGAVNPGNGVALVEIPLSRQKKQVVPRLDGKCLALHNTGFVLGINLNPGFEALLVGHGQQPHIGLVKPTGYLIGGHSNLLHQPHLVGIHRGQAVQ